MIVKLGSLISEYSVRNKADENIPVYSVTNEQGFCTGYFSKEVASQDRTTYKIVPRGCQTYMQWNTSRKTAYFSLGCAVFACAIAVFFIK